MTFIHFFLLRCLKTRAPDLMLSTPLGPFLDFVLMMREYRIVSFMLFQRRPIKRNFTVIRSVALANTCSNKLTHGQSSPAQLN